MKDSVTRRLFAIAASAVIGILVVPTLAGAQNNCVDCHSTLDDERFSHPARAMTQDVHAGVGLTCVNCHGGDPSVAIVDGDDGPAKAPGTGFVGAPSVSEIPTFCGNCHADAGYMQDFDPNLPVDQLAQFWTSGHGARLRDGALDVAQCVSCHSAHGILSARDPAAPVYPTKMADTCGQCHADDDYMSESDLDTDQVDLYRESVHGATLYDVGDLSAPTCNNCHGNHGAAPPEVGSVSLVCGNCHAMQRELFGQGPHKEKFEEMGDPECESCHGNHDVRAVTDDFLGVGDEQVCSGCHSEGEEPWDVAIALRADIEDLKSKLAEATETIERAAFAGMEMSDAEIVMIDANQSLVKARNVVHAVSLDALREETDEGRTLAEEARQLGLTALEELQFRRKGLVVSVFFILLVVAGLYLKIHQIESASDD